MQTFRIISFRSFRTARLRANLTVSASRWPARLVPVGRRSSFTTTPQRELNPVTVTMRPRLFSDIFAREMQTSLGERFALLLYSSRFHDLYFQASIFSPFMKIPLAIGLAILALLTLANGAPAASKLRLSTFTFSQVVSSNWTTFTLSCNGASLNATTFNENLAGRDPGSILLRIDSMGPFAVFLYQNLSYASIGQTWCLHGFALIDAALALSYYGSLTTRLISSGNYTLVGQVLAGSGNPLSRLTRLSETWTTTTII